MARKKKSRRRSTADHDYVFEFPTERNLLQQLTERTREPWKRLKEVVVAAHNASTVVARMAVAVKLRTFWEDRLDDLDTRETQTEAPNYINTTWLIMGRLFRQTASIAPPPKPRIVLPLCNQAGEPVPPRSSSLISDYRRCRGAYLDLSGEVIPIDEGALEDAVKTIIEWCRQVEAPVPLIESPEIEGVPDPENRLVLRGKGYNRVLLKYMWKRELVTGDELRSVLHAERRRRKHDAPPVKDKAFRDAIRYFDLFLENIILDFPGITLDKHGDMFYLAHPQKNSGGNLP